MSERVEKIISLREASKISGYSRDYIGSLIRQKKIYGTQVSGSVSWFTTAEDIVRYVESTSAREKYYQKVRRSMEEDSHRAISMVVPSQAIGGRVITLVSGMIFGVAMLLLIAIIFLFVAIIAPKFSNSPEQTNPITENVLLPVETSIKP